MEAKTNNSSSQGRNKIVSISRTFDLPVSTVWKAWTEPESFKKWWGPKDFTCPECKIDLKVGGKTLACMKSNKDGKEYWSTATYVEIVPNKRLVYQDDFSDSKGNKVDPSYYNMGGTWGDVKVTVEFEDMGSRTRMVMTQSGIPEEMYDDCIKGWQECFDKMEKI